MMVVIQVVRRRLNSGHGTWRPVLALALQLLFMKVSESMGTHDSEIVDADAHSVD
jgi:hypothetical protein